MAILTRPVPVSSIRGLGYGFSRVAMMRPWYGLAGAAAGGIYGRGRGDAMQDAAIGAGLGVGVAAARSSGAGKAFMSGLESGGLKAGMSRAGGRMMRLLRAMGR